MRGADTKVLQQELTHTKASTQVADQRVMTIVITTNALLRTGVQHILSGTRFALINQSVDPPTSLSLGPEDGPVLLLIDGQTARKPDDSVRSVKAKHPHARAVILAEHFDFDFLIQARQAGVDGFCLTSADPKVLINSFELVMLGEPVLPSAMVLSFLREVRHSQTNRAEEPLAASEISILDGSAAKLSNREWEVLQYLSRGAQNKEIARKFNVTDATVKVHVKAILRKIGAVNRTQAAMWATEHLPNGSGTAT